MRHTAVGLHLGMSPVLLAVLTEDTLHDFTKYTDADVNIVPWSKLWQTASLTYYPSLPI
jgi:hypothetical protein